MTNKAKVISLPKATLVTFDRQETVDKDGNKLQQIYYLDRNNNGLDVGDRVYEFYYVSKPGKRADVLIAGDVSLSPRMEIRERSLTAKDIRRYKATFKRRFKKLVKTARAHRPSAKKIPKFTKGKCSAFWRNVKNGRVVSNPFLPGERNVRFNKAVTLTTTLKTILTWKRNRVRYDSSKINTVDPRLCLSIRAKTKISLPGQATLTSATVSAGGIPRYPIWMSELFHTNHFKSQYPSYIKQVGVDYMFGGNHYIHLALTDTALVASRR